MTLTLRADCPDCHEAIRVPLLKGEDDEGRFLSVRDEVLVDQAKTCEVNA